MAWVLSTIKATFTVIDDDGAQSSHSIYIPVSFDMVAAVNFAIAAAPKVVALIGGALTGINVTAGIYDNSFPTPGADTDTEEKGVFQVRTADNTISNLAVPSVLAAKYVDTGKRAGIDIDFTDADVIAYVAVLEDGIEVDDGAGVPTTVTPCDSRGADLVSVINGYKQHRASYKSRGGQG